MKFFLGCLLILLFIAEMTWAWGWAGLIFGVVLAVVTAVVVLICCAEELETWERRATKAEEQVAILLAERDGRTECRSTGAWIEHGQVKPVEALPFRIVDKRRPR